TPVQFDFFETFGPILRSADGKVLACEWEREETCPAEPVLVAPGKKETFLLSAWLGSERHDKGRCLFVCDGSGGVYTFEGLAPGKYLLSFAYNNWEVEASDRPGFGDRQAQKNNPPYWYGKVVTDEVEFEVIVP